ncbi:MAG: HesA/MoeB/ThiF family protein [Gemmataceae bacterium]
MSDPLTPEELALYQWQLPVDGFGLEGQRRLKRASVLVSRVGGVGGAVAQQLAAAGVGRLVLAHAGPLRVDDLNRQILMSNAGVGRSRVEQAAERLRQMNPHLAVEAIAENVNATNVERLMAGVDVVASCAPLFEERLVLNAAAVRQGKALVDSAMFDLDLQVMTVLPGRPPCLACLCPEPPSQWRRQFPVFGAVAGVAGCLAAMEVIKTVAGIGTPLTGQMLLGDLRQMTFSKLKIAPRPECSVCGRTTKPPY